MHKKLRKGLLSISLAFALALLIPGCSSETNVLSDETLQQTVQPAAPSQETQETNTYNSGIVEGDIQASNDFASVQDTVNISDIPAYAGEPYVELDGNVPGFTEEELTTQSFESYSPLDDLERCQTAYACIGPDLMPTEDRDSISDVKPSGWHTYKYDFVDGGYLYNRCHLIGYQLTAENANERNLITGTRYLNVEGMLPFENMVADYIKETGNHVMYRVTPVYEGDNLVTDGVIMEAYSVEDEGEGISFHVFCYNVQPGVTIDYATGESQGDGSSTKESDTSVEAVTEAEYILNTNTMKFHLPSCSSVSSMSEKNKEDYTGDRETLIEEGYEPCKNCNP